MTIDLHHPAPLPEGTKFSDDEFDREIEKMFQNVLDALALYAQKNGMIMPELLAENIDLLVRMRVDTAIEKLADRVEKATGIRP